MEAGNLAGLQTAASILLERLREKDYQKFMQLIVFSPPDVLHNTGYELPPFTGLGRRVKGLCDKGVLQITMDSHGVVQKLRSI